MMHSVAGAYRNVVPRLAVDILRVVPKRMSSSAGAAGNRLSGRSRFYKEVGVKSLEIPPWKDVEKLSSPATPLNDEAENVESPISAGVDGTSSASGVHHIPRNGKNSLRLEEILTPRFPGDEPTSGGNGSNDDSNKISWYGITLDGRKVSTPMGQTLAVPSETLAYMIAAEWDSQTKELQPSNMPMMTLACTALDQASMHPQYYRDTALKYLPTDTVRTV